MGLLDWANAIASIESAGSGGYSALGPVTGKGNRAYGRYQVMDFNVGPWTEKYFGRRLSPEEFLKTPEAQDAVFQGEFGSYVNKYGNPQDAASAWFTGKPLSQGSGRKDILGTTGAGYVDKFNRALGQGVASDTMAALGKGQPMANIFPRQETMSTQGQQRQGFLGGLLSDPDKRAQLIIALEGMTMNPNQALMQTAAEGIKKRREGATTEKQRNATADWLAKQGRADLAEAVRTGAVPAMAAVQSAMAQPKDERTALQKNYEFFVQQGLSPEEARQAVRAGTTVNVGGEGGPSVFQKEVDKKFAERYLDWKTTGAADTSQQVAQISSVLSQLEEGQPLTGPVIGAISNVGLGAILTPDAQDARDRVESVVQRSLRETLGAQFTEKEGQRLIERSYNPSLRPEQNAARLRALYETLSSADKAKRAMIEYVEQNGTMAGYTGPTIPSADEIEAAMDAATPFSGEAKEAGTATHRFNPETGQVEEIK